MSHLLQPQEIEVFYIIPSLRKQLALEMKKLGYKQNKIASLLAIEEAAVSQYINDKRGSKIDFEPEIKNEIVKSAAVITDRLTLLREMQHLLRAIKDTREICRIHKQLSDVPQECTPEAIDCFGGKHAKATARICI